MKIVFNDSYKSNALEYGVEAINKLLKPHHLKVDITFLDDYGLDGIRDAILFENPHDDDGEFAWEIKVENDN
tara:strand:+ start:420 stop:635 length:216 start_codon:yes stop_codon:yes gene_type:complete